MAVAGWWAEQRQASVAYLVEENRILRIGFLAGFASPIKNLVGWPSTGIG
jgi:hypothetical protein